MTHTAIRAEGLSKLYTLGHRQHYVSLRESLTSAVTAPFRLVRRATTRQDSPLEEAAKRSLWALDDVSFDVGHGEVLAVIGRNGAGKSTLLKLLSRITEPTKGYAELHGRVGSLLEVGTGFHPELTGRENVFLNGALLGMRRNEIEQDFDAIIDFAEVGQFVDTPVKHYSSGMTLRLAFAVAVHLRPEILIVDEVLAVGDAQFQKRCMNKMREVSRQGRTILFVSHNMAAMRLICDRAIHLEKGRLVDAGEVNEVVDRYLAKMLMAHRGTEGIDTPTAVIEDVTIRSLTGPVIKTFDPIEVSVTVKAKIDEPEVGLMIAFTTLEQQRLAALVYNDLSERVPVKAGQRTTVTFTVESLPFLPGSYQVELYLKDWALNNWRQVPEAFVFEVVESPIYGSRKIDQSYGLVGLKARAEAEIDAGRVNVAASSGIG